MALQYNIDFLVYIISLLYINKPYQLKTVFPHSKVEIPFYLFCQKNYTITFTFLLHHNQNVILFVGNIFFKKRVNVCNLAIVFFEGNRTLQIIFFASFFHQTSSSFFVFPHTNSSNTDTVRQKKEILVP